MPRLVTAIDEEVVLEDDPWNAPPPTASMVLPEAPALPNAGLAHPVDPRMVPDYYDIVAQPMDLSQVQENIDLGLYNSPKQFMKDMQLIADNVVLYNPRHDPNRLVHRAHAMLVRFGLAPRVALRWHSHLACADEAPRVSAGAREGASAARTRPRPGSTTSTRTW